MYATFRSDCSGDYSTGGGGDDGTGGDEGAGDGGGGKKGFQYSRKTDCLSGSLQRKESIKTPRNLG